jgi:hypothetical protein
MEGSDEEKKIMNMLRVSMHGGSKGARRDANMLAMWMEKK